MERQGTSYQPDQHDSLMNKKRNISKIELNLAELCASRDVKEKLKNKQGNKWLIRLFKECLIKLSKLHSENQCKNQNTI